MNTIIDTRRVVKDAEIRQAILYEAVTTEKLELILFPTEKCNFRCVYCYEDFALGRMSDDTLSGIRNLILERSRDLKHLHISWFGGEPLAAYDIVRDMCDFAGRLAAEKGFSFESSMTTNGYNLSEARWLELTGLGVRRYQISLDGDQEAHDQTRLRLDGAGTFERIWTNIQSFNALSEAGRLGGAKVLLRLHVHQGNIASVKALLARIRDELTLDFYDLHIKPVGNWGGTGDGQLAVINERSSEFKALLEDLAPPKPNMSLGTEAAPYVCYASKGNSFAIRSDGAIAKCTVALSNPANRIGRITASGAIQFEQGKLEPWLHGLVSMDAADLSCPVSRLPRPATA
jgi:uncharacterized protein